MRWLCSALLLLAAQPAVCRSSLPSFMGQENAMQNDRRGNDESYLYNKLMEKAKPLDRSLQSDSFSRELGNDGENEDEEATFASGLDEIYDFSNYALKFARCQLVQRFSERAVKRGEYSAMTKDNLVVLRMCPVNSCSSSSEKGCSSGYGEYVISLNDYLSTMMQYALYKRQSYCNFCSYCSTGEYYYDNRRLEGDEGKENENNEKDNENRDNEKEEEKNENDKDEQDEGNEDNEDDAEGDAQDDAEDEDEGENDEEEDADADVQQENEMKGGYYNDGEEDAEDYYYAGESNSTYYYESGPSYDCDTYYNSECNNWDATCANSYSDYSEYLSCVQVDGGDNKYYLGPYCDGSSIIIGIFYDPYCAQYAGDSVSINQATGLSFYKNEFEEYYNGECVSCAPDTTGPYGSANSLMCNQLYSDSAKCNSNMAVSYDSNGHVSQFQSTACEYSKSILNDAFDSDGSISSVTTNKASSSKSGTYSRHVTVPQIALLFFGSTLCLGLALYGCYLHHEITNLLLKQLSMRGKLLPKQGRRRYDSESDADSQSTGSGSAYVMA